MELENMSDSQIIEFAARLAPIVAGMIERSKAMNPDRIYAEQVREINCRPRSEENFPTPPGARGAMRSGPEADQP